jgi:hypothetical protein
MVIDNLITAGVLLILVMVVIYAGWSYDEDLELW